jgi:predicted CXXCH cytochrome family protein
LDNYLGSGAIKMLNQTKDTRRLAGRLVKSIAAAALVFGAVSAHAGIAATKHNLGAQVTLTQGGGQNINYMSSGTTEICVFCHTPHASNTAVKAPLWNKPTGTGYTTYSTATSATIDGNVDMSGVSLACLSCHDGTQAMDTMINKPGSGGYDVAGSVLSAGGAAWNGADQLAGKMINAGQFIANLSKDLTNDHPVGIQYCGGGLSTGSASSTAAGTTTGCRDVDFHAPQTDTIGGATAWWVDSTGGTAAKRDKKDMILYARTATFAGDATSGFYQPFVECASCHDPHSDVNPTFLRISNNQSGVCLTCHNK